MLLSVTLQTMAEVAVREMLKEIAAKTFVSSGHCKLSASDLMDDGSRIQLTINIDPTEVRRINRIFIIFILNDVIIVCCLVFSVLYIFCGCNRLFCYIKLCSLGGEIFRIFRTYRSFEFETVCKEQMPICFTFKKLLVNQ